MLPVPSGSRTLKALRITSSGSAPGEDRRRRLVKINAVEIKVFHYE